MLLYTIPGLICGWLLSGILLVLDYGLFVRKIRWHRISPQGFWVIGILVWLTWTAFCFFTGMQIVDGYVAVSWGFFFSWLTVGLIKNIRHKRAPAD